MDHRNMQPLHYATSRGLIDVAHLLLDEGASLDWPLGQNAKQSPLHMALCYGNGPVGKEMLGLAGRLVTMKVALDKEDHYGMMPLHYALQREDDKVGVSSAVAQSTP